MKVLLVGGGAREHAMGWKLAQSPRLGSLISAPGNPGLAELGAVLPGVDVNDPATVVDASLANGVDLVVVGPEAPLAAGLADELVAAGIPTCGPTKRGARLEASKAYSKDVMARSEVPTASAATFSDVDAAVAHLETVEPPYVVKADGLAAGKGVLVTEDLIAAQGWARLCIEGAFGDAGRTVVIEQHLDGDEVSVFALCDGSTAVGLGTARDYKRLLDDDRGPNTGGMGCYTPPRDVPDDLVHRCMEEVVGPVLATLADDGVAYRGFLYAGLMLVEDELRVLEFNCRLGDPEAQVLLPLLDADLLDLAAAAAAGSLESTELDWLPGAAVDVVLASGGYPDQPRRDDPIVGIEDAAALDRVHLFHAGTRQTAAGLVTSGGRVLNVVGRGPDVAAARAAAYAAVERIHFEDMQYRSDIAG